MLKLKNKINGLWKAFAGGGTILAYQAWIDRMSKNKEQEILKQEIFSVNSAINSLSKKIDNCVDPDLKNKLLSDQKELSNIVRVLWEKHEYFVQRYNMLDNNAIAKESLFNEYKEQFSKEFEKLSNKVSEFDKNNFLDDFDIWGLINKFKEFLSTLSLTELCFIINIFASIFIIGCLVSIIFALFGNYIIEKFNLDKKYRLLSSIIRLRVKMQLYYIILNTIFILLTTILILYVNVITLLQI